MKFRIDFREITQFGWHRICLLTGLLGAAFLSFGLYRTSAAILAVSVVTALTGGLMMLKVVCDFLQTNSEKFDRTLDEAGKNREILEQLIQLDKMSDLAKSIAFKDNDIQYLRESVISRLHQRDFDSTFKMIDAMTSGTQFRETGEKLLALADKYKNATEEEQISQMAAHVRELAEAGRFSQASTMAEKLIRAYPAHESVKNLPKTIKEKRNKRKKELIAAWDQAVKKEDTQRSLEILRQLDQYLTPTEALAFQESVSSVFKTRLHNLGVSFSLAVSDAQWDKAIDTGQVIIKEFPNSRMAHEIKNSMKYLEDKQKSW